MSSDRFHKAAKDGLLDLLKEATRRDINTKDNDSMTPVMWAAFEGRLDALRLLCGKGGDPDKCDQFGNTCLHLAAAKGHLQCVDFLVKFGVNIYALDIDKHSAKDLAAINNRDEILRYLDAATAKFRATEKKKAKAMKELAEKNCEKRVREYMKRQGGTQPQRPEYCDVSPPPVRPPTVGKSTNVLFTLKQKFWSSQGNLSRSDDNKKEHINSTKYSDLVGSGASSSGASTMSRRMVPAKQKIKAQHSTPEQCGAFKIGEIEADGRRTITSLTGLQRDSEVLYVGTFSSNEDGGGGKRGKISDVFEVEETYSDTERDSNRLGYGTLSRSFSQPDILGADVQGTEDLSRELMLQRPMGLFDRPTMLGSIAFRRSITAALCQLQPDIDTYNAGDNISNSTANTLLNQSTRAAKSRMGSKPRLYLNLSDDTDSEGGDDIFSEDDDQEEGGSPLQRFLTVWALEEYYAVFQKQQIDLETLMLLTESDLKSLGLPLGPFRKLTFAIQERRNALANPGPMHDSVL